MAERIHLLLRGTLIVALCLIAAPLLAQPQVRFGTSTPPVQLAQAVAPAPATQLGAPQGWDPYAAGGYTAPAQVAPALPQGYPQTQVYPTTPYATQPPALQPQVVAPAQPYGAPVPPPPAGAYPTNAPASVFPNGLGTGQPYGQPVIPGWQQAQPYVKLFNRVYFQYTWLPGSSGDDMDINDIDINVTAAFPNFLYSEDPLYVTPGFTMHLWQGPDGSFLAGDQNVPARAYSAYLGFGWQPRLPSYRQLGADLAVVVGVYSDFNAINNDSVRIQGTGLLSLQLTPTLALKAGIVYLDRVKIKLLPAGGVVWTPNERTEFNILFPNPKLRKYWNTLGTTDVWWYIEGEYGDGSWTVEMLDGTDDQMDINDIRIGAGLEFVRQGGGIIWIEGGYVFDRKLNFAHPAAYGGLPEVNLSDTFMVRGGISF